MNRKHIYEIVNGHGDSAEAYGHVMTVVIVVSLVPLCFKDYNLVFGIIENVCTVIFIADYLVRLITADFKLGKGKASFLLYPFTPMALVDLISILPTFIALNPAWRALRTLRLLRAIRAFKLVRYSKSVIAVTNVFKKQRRLLLVVFGFAITYVAVSALVIFNVEPETFDTFFDAVYWAVVSLTTVGYGDLYPASDAGRLIAMISSLMGVAIVALPSCIITAGLLEELNSEVEELNSEEKTDRQR